MSAIPHRAGVAPAPAARARERLARWLSRRRGPYAGDHVLTRRNVFVLPTRAGLLFAVVLLVMLLAAINYQLSLGHALTFLLVALAAVGMLHTYRNLSALTLHAGRAEPVFAGQLAEFTLIARNPTRLERYALSVHAHGMTQAEHFDAAPGAEQLVSIALPTERRGWMQVPRLTVSTTWPLGLWRAWAPWHPVLRVLVYPQPETPAVALPARMAAAGEGTARGPGHDDLAAVRPYAAGDAPRLIAWKAMARSASDELLTKQFDGAQLGELSLEWSQLPASMHAEARLARLTRWVLDADAAGVRFALVLPGCTVEADAGPAHRARCLEALATWGG
ncbi:MAG: DUF58 domain-containing protein [Burkholderiales bacterium]|nr:DUF58 domain-containing protein [Burkholderiales bacterium]